MNQHVTVATSALSTRALIVSLHIQQWTGRRLDREVTDEINSNKHAKADAGRYNKALLPANALSEITGIVSATRTGFVERTLPWIDKGGRIMSADAYLDFMAWINGKIAAYETAVDNFIKAYPSYVSSANNRLGDMFNIDEYPDPTELRNRFAIKVNTMPVPDKNDFRVDMSEAQASQIRADIERQVQEATQDAIRDIYRRVVEVTKYMAERLKGFRPSKGKGDRAEGVFRDSLVENVRELVAILPSLNITGDPALAEIADELKPLIEYDAEILRKDAGKRADVAAEAQAIADRMSAFV